MSRLGRNPSAIVTLFALTASIYTSLAHAETLPAHAEVPPARNEVSMILSVVASGSEASVAAISRHPLVSKSEPVFGVPETRALNRLGEGLLAQSVKLTVQNEDAAKQLSTWVKLKFGKVLLENNSAVTGMSVAAPEPLEHYQWALSNTGESQGTDLDDITTLEIPGKPGEDLGLVHAPLEAHIGAPPIRVAVLDSGVDTTHPDLQGQILKKPDECKALEALTACQTEARSNARARAECVKTFGSVDADGNGYPLDCRGWNVTGNTQGPTGVLGDADTSDLLGHGTHVSGIIGAAENGIGIRGVISNVRIIPVRVIDRNPNTPIRPQDLGSPTPIPSPNEDGFQGSRSFADIIARGMLYAITNQAQVINMSLAWPAAADSALMRRMVRLAQDRGILVVASAGNDSNEAQAMPCAYTGVVCVGAHGPDGALTYFSNYGPAVDVAAPGLKILSTWPMNRRAYTFTELPGYEYKNGTSMAAPYVTGILARLLNDGYSPRDAYARLLLGARTHQPSAIRSAQMAQKTTRSGNADLTATYRVSPQPLILPATKDLIRISWDRKTVEIPLTFTLSNQWTTAQGPVRIQARIGDTAPGARFARLSDSDFSVTGWKSGEEKTFSTNLRILDPRVDGRLSIDLTIDTGFGAPRTLQIPVEITVPVTPDLAGPEFSELPIIGSVIPNASLRTVTAIRRGSRGEYVALQRGDKNWQIQLITEETGSYRAAPPSTVPVLDGELFLVNRIDGKTRVQDTYVFILRINPAAGSAIRRFAFHFFDSELKPLSSMIYDNSASTLNERFQWLAHTIDGQEQRVPAWIGFGTTPQLEQPDRSNDPWGLIDEDTQKYRFYFVGLDGEAHSIQAPKGYSFVETLSPSAEQVENGEIPVLLFKGQGYDVSYARAIVRDQQVESIVPLHFDRYRNLAATGTLQEVFSLERSTDVIGTAFSGVSTSGSQRTTLIPTSSTQVTFDAEQSALNPTESVTRVVGVFEGSASAGVFVQTHYELQYHDLVTGQVANTSLNRFSFLPTFIQQKSFYPVVTANRLDPVGERLPAVLVPSGLGDTNANEVIVPALDANGRLGLSRPARLRLEDTDRCVSLGKPRLATPDAATQIVFFCGDRFLHTTLAF